MQRKYQQPCFISKKKFNLLLHIKSKLQIITGDSYKLIQLFQIFLSNAVKYLDKENGLIEVDCKSADRYWKFSVSENGIGIPKKY